MRRASRGCVASCCWLVALAAGLARAGDPSPLLTADTAVVVRVDLARVDPARLERLIFGPPPAPPEAADALRSWRELVAGFRAAGPGEVFGLIELTDEAGPPILAVPIGDVAEVPPAVAAAFRPLGPPPQVARGFAVLAPPEVVARLRSGPPTPRPDLLAALAEGPAGAAIRVAVAPGATLRRAAEDSLPALPPLLGGGPVRALSGGLDWLAVALVLEPEATVRAVARARDDAAARSVAEVAGRSRAAVAAAFEADPLVRDLGPALTRVEPRVEGDRVILAAGPAWLEASSDAWNRLMGRARGEAQVVNDLKQIGLAMHNYHAAHDVFPPAYTEGVDGRPLLSWRVLILPHLGEQKLYDEFRLDEPWDGPHNKALIPRMPQVYADPMAPGVAAAGRTTFLTPRGEGTMFPGSRPVGLADVTDGTSNTIMAVEGEAADAVPWTKPDDYGRDAPPRPLGRTRPILFGDGAVLRLGAGLSVEAFRAMLTRAGGEVVRPAEHR